MALKDTLKQWWHKLGSPRWFYDISAPWQMGFAVFACLLLVIGTIWGLD